eukprot:16427033-Heterocapsa_arctica.AAC.1
MDPAASRRRNRRSARRLRGRGHPGLRGGRQSGACRLVRPNPGQPLDRILKMAPSPHQQTAG